MAEHEAYLIEERWAVAHPLKEECTRIGRDASNGILIRDGTVSRFHAEVRRADDAYALTVVGAAGAMLNGKPVIGRCWLNEGDVIEIAYTRLRFTTKRPTRDFMPAAPPVVDPEVAEPPTEIREIMTPNRIRQLRRPVTRPVWPIIAVVLTAAVVVALVLLFRK